MPRTELAAVGPIRSDCAGSPVQRGNPLPQNPATRRPSSSVTVTGNSLGGFSAMASGP